MAIVTEFMNKGSLRDVLNSAKPDRSMTLKLAIDAATGMNYLHSYTPPIIHRYEQNKRGVVFINYLRDLKSMNLLVDSSFKVKVIVCLRMALCNWILR
jgi:serine/threonine protein kinase